MNPAYPKLQEAASFAARSHAGQMRKDGKTPYASHPFRVCLIVRDLFGFDDPHMLMTALLHDVIEDTTTDFDDVAESFGNEVASWVACLSKDKRLVEPEREQRYIAQVLAAPWQVHVCKLADIFDNLTDILPLPPDSRRARLRRVDQYVEALSNAVTPDTVRPLTLVRELLQKVRDS